MPRLIDADALLDEICRDQCERKHKDCDSTCELAAYVVNAPTIGEEMAEALDCYRRYHACLGGIECEQTKCKWRCDGRAIGLDHGYCAGNNLLGDVVRLLGGEPGKGVILRCKAD